MLNPVSPAAFRPWILCWFILYFVAIAVEARAQSIAPFSSPGPQYSFARISEDEVLSQSDVRALAQDKEGFIWFGLRLGGLVRYDGYEIVVHQHDPDDEGSLGSSVIWSLLVDRRGTLWIGTEGGLDRYDREKGLFVHYRADLGRTDRLPNNVVVCLAEDASGKIWAGTRAGLCRLDDPASGKFSVFRRRQVVDGSTAKDTFRSILEDPSSGLLWLGATDGLAAFDPRTGEFASFLHDPMNPASLSHNAVNKVVRANDGVFWALTESGVDSFVPDFTRIEHDRTDEPRLQFRHFVQPSGVENPGINFVRDGVIDKRNRFWLGTRAGLQLLDRATGNFSGFRFKAADPTSLSDDLTQAVLEDRAGNIWIGTYHGGASLLRANAKPFHVHRHDPEDAGTLSEERITALGIDPKGRIWASTASGLDRYDVKEGKWTRFLHNPTDPNSIPTNELSTMATAPNGDIWVGTNYDGLYRFDQHRFHAFPTSPSNVPAPNGWRTFTGQQVHSILSDSVGGVWIGARGYGLDYFLNGRFLHYNPQDASRGLAAQPTTNVSFGFFGDDGSLWFTTEASGLIRFDPKTQKFTAFQPSFDHPGATVNLNCLAKGKDGTIWLGAASGLIKFDPRSETFVRRYNMLDGLPHPAVVTIVEDLRGHLWLGTANGLADFDPRTDVFRVYEKPDGLPSNVFSQRSGAVDSAGVVYLGTRAGVVAFSPEELRDNAMPPPVVLTEFRWIGGAPAVDARGRRSMPKFPDAIHIPPGQLGFSLKFAALDFTAPEKNRFRHRLEGWDAEWSSSNAKERSVTYTALPPGTYTFHVRASNADLVWNESGASVRIIVEPHYWQTTWFRVGNCFLGLVFIVVGIQWRLRVVRRRNAQLEKQVSSRTAQLQAEVEVRQKAETALRDSYAELERRVLARTSELARTNASLQNEIAERKNIESQLRQSQKMEAVGQLAGGVAHDFNNLLTVILGQSEFLTDLGMSPNERAAAVRDIKAAAQRATNLTRQLLVFSRHQTMNPVPVDLNEVVSNVTKLLSHVIGEHISLETKLSAKSIGLLADAGMLEQVLLNMAVNARDAMPHGGILRITTDRKVISESRRHMGAEFPPGEYARFSVSDTGTGIPREIAARVFEPFFTTKEAGKGTGLGLAISLGIVQQHHGWIEVESLPGNGATFHVYLPASQLAIPAASEPAPGIPSVTGDTTILLVEDEIAVRTVVRHMLSRKGYRVFEAASGVEALALWEKRRAEVEVLLTDIVMPGAVDGRELATRLQSANTKLKVITMSGYDPGETDTDGKLSRPHLRKPFTANDLLQMIEGVLAGRNTMVSDKGAD